MKPTFLIAAIIVLFLGCDSDINEAIPENWIYFNSFEKTADVQGWQGAYLSKDVPHKGGDSSLVVSGGCLIPHVTYEIGPLETGGVFSVQCMGKSPLGGTIHVFTKNPYNAVLIDVNSKDWTLYDSNGLVYCAAGEKLYIEMSSGGKMEGGMWIDLFRIVKKELEL